ncbi:MAG: porin family protein [Mucilaginibacter sp.]
MKKTSLILLLVFTYFVTDAQTINYGIKAGLNLSNQSRTNFQVDLKSDYVTGIHVGGIVDISYQNFSIQPGLLFSTLGEKITIQTVNQNGEGLSNIDSKTVLNYIQVPVNFLYKIKLSADANVHFGGGPYFGYGISAGNRTDGKSYPAAFNRNSANVLNYKNPDYGVSFVAGTTLQNKFIVDAGYSLGLANLYYVGPATLHNRAITLSIGYLFK